MPQEPVTLIPYGDDPLALLAQHLLEDYKTQLPDLTQAVVLLSEPHASIRLRQLLLEQAEQLGFKALLCPKISNLRDWSKQQFHKAQATPQTICSQHQRELILFDALTQYKALLGSGSPWHLSDDLLKLFDQLTANLKSLPDSYDEFEEEIAQGYGLSVDDFPALSQEANLVYTLWNAWHTQLNAENMFDSEAAYLLGLNADIEHNQNTLYIAGYHQFSTAEQNWLEQLITKQRCQLYLHGQTRNETTAALNNYHPDQPCEKLAQQLNINVKGNSNNNGYTEFLNQCYANEEQSFQQRTENFPKTNQAEIKAKLKLLFCKGHEEQSHAVELQVRRLLLAGKKNIGIVTENRRLARRVRALLERADVPLHDLAGWALSTTRSGAVLERWLECIEEDFSYLPLLDILKSPFIFNQLDQEEVKHAAYRLEHDIIRQENISRNLQSYKNNIANRTERLQWPSKTVDTLNTIIDTFETAHKLLLPLLHGKHSAISYIEKLSQSLSIIGMHERLEQDAAGLRVLEMLDTLKHSAQQYDLSFSWADFRTWLGRSLEKFVFSPEQNNLKNPVTLMGLGQSRLQRFDALIIASAEHEHLPGKSNVAPFFNNAVRLQLNLSSSHEVLTERFHHFRRLLESSDDILITANHEENGEEVPLSPWLEIIHAFYKKSFSDSLEDEELKSLVNDPQTIVIRCTDKTLPEKTERAEPILPTALVPTKYSASSYQKLIDCPYQFFAAYGLQLSPSEEVQEALSKGDYGERVHRCLEAFHSDMSQYTGPFKGKLDKENREEAIDLLNEISQQVFARDLEGSFEHSGWFEQWLKIIPDYIDWQISNNENWQFHEAEHKGNVVWKNGIELNGRLDRIDKNKEGLSIIDYKTGQYANLTQVTEGEAVQLPFYALLAETESDQAISQVSYLDLDKKAKLGTQLAGDELATISHKIGERLSMLIEQMQGGSKLTAWGDTTTCQRCNMDRLCRRQIYEN